MPPESRGKPKPPPTPTTTKGEQTLSGLVTFNVEPAGQQLQVQTRVVSATGAAGAWSAALAIEAPPIALQVDPVVGPYTSGPQGGPFSPVSFTYHLWAMDSSVEFLILNVPSWLSASQLSGSVDTTGTDVTFSVTDVATRLPVGTHQSFISFSNIPSGLGNISLPAVITISA